MPKSRSHKDRFIQVRDVETGELLQVKWRDWTVSNKPYGSGKGQSEAWLVKGNDPLNPTGDPKRFKALLSERVVELIED